MKAFIGCDPGGSGGIAVIRDGIAVAYKMPETERDLWDLVSDLRQFNDGDVEACIEKVHSMPKQGVKSTFTFGMGYGALRMAVIASGIPFRDVTPQTWQKALGCQSGGNKNVTKAKAQQFFPNLKITHAIADALLIAKWLSQQP